MLVVEGRRKGLSLVQVCQDTLQVVSRLERRAQGEPEIDGLLARGALLWQMREGTEGLFEVPYSLTVRRARQGLLPRLPAILQSLVPHLASQSVMGQAFDLLGYLLSSERLDGLHDTGV